MITKEDAGKKVVEAGLPEEEEAALLAFINTLPEQGLASLPPDHPPDKLVRVLEKQCASMVAIAEGEIGMAKAALATFLKCRQEELHDKGFDEEDIQKLAQGKYTRVEALKSARESSLKAIKLPPALIDCLLAAQGQEPAGGASGSIAPPDAALKAVRTGTGAGPSGSAPGSVVVHYVEDASDKLRPPPSWIFETKALNEHGRLDIRSLEKVGGLKVQRAYVTADVVQSRRGLSGKDVKLDKINYLFGIPVKPNHHVWLKWQLQGGQNWFLTLLFGPPQPAFVPAH